MVGYGYGGTHDVDKCIWGGKGSGGEEKGAEVKSETCHAGSKAEENAYFEKCGKSKEDYLEK